MDLDAISSNTSARSAVELSLNPHFRRHYTALNKAVIVNALPKQKLTELASQTISAPSKREFHLLAVNVTSAARPFADTLRDRGFAYQPTPKRISIRSSPKDFHALSRDIHVCLPGYSRR